MDTLESDAKTICAIITASTDIVRLFSCSHVAVVISSFGVNGVSDIVPMCAKKAYASTGIRMSVTVSLRLVTHFKTSY